METAFISFNATNFLTIAIMAVLTWLLLSMVVQAYRNMIGR